MNSLLRILLLAAGVRYVIAGGGPNYAGQKRLSGAGLLARYMRRLMGFGVAPLDALAIAKKRLRLSVVVHRLLGQAKILLM